MKLQSRIAAFVVIATFVISAKSADAFSSGHINPYGNLFVFFGYLQSTDYETGEKKEIDKDTFYTINNNSNFGLEFSYQNYSGVFELGISDHEEEKKVRIRKAYGTYTFDIGKLMIGQNWNPYVKWSHESANYYRSDGFGALYEDLTTQLMIVSNFGFYLDIIKPYVPTETYYLQQDGNNPALSAEGMSDEYKLVAIDREITTGENLDNIQALLPKMAFGYQYNSKKFQFGIGAAGNAYKIKKSEDIEFNKEWIVSYLLYLNTTMSFNKLVLNINCGYAVNPANFGISVQSTGNDRYRGGAAAAVHNVATGKYEIKDTWNAQGYAEIGWSLTQNILFHAGYGYSMVDYPMENTEVDRAMEYYLNAKFNLGDLIAIIPSVSYHDFMKDMDNDEEGNDIYGGILAIVSFY